MKSKPVPQKVFLLILYGYPGCGKTTFSEKLAKQLQNTVHLYTDKITRELSQVTGGNFELANNVISYMTENYLENGLSVIVDAPVIKSTDRRTMRNIAIKHKAVPILVWMQMDPESAFHRLKLQAKNKKNKFSRAYTRTEFDEIVNSMQNPKNEDFVVVSGKHTYKSQSVAVLNKMVESKILSRDQIAKNFAKPELTNIIPQPTLGGRGVFRRNISVR